VEVIDLSLVPCSFLRIVCSSDCSGALGFARRCWNVFAVGGRIAAFPITDM